MPHVAVQRRVLRCLFPGLLAVIGAAGHAAPDGSPTLYVNGRIHTMDERQPRADAMLVEGGRIAWIGAGAPDAAPARRIDLGGRFVMPGLIDAHTHPGIAAILGDQVSGGFDAESRDSFFGELEDVAEGLDGDGLVLLAEWDVAMFLPEGPHKADLDPLFGDAPVVIFDNSAHSYWLNSAALALFGVDAQTEDMSPGLSEFVRDESGEATGWVKEFAILPMLIEALPGTKADRLAALREFLAYLSAHGVTALYDAGNFNAEGAVHDLLAELDRRGELPLRYHAGHHVYSPDQLDGAVEEVLRLRRRYADARRLRFDTVKIHYDGVVEVGTAAMLEPYLTDSSNRGAFLADAQRLAVLLLDLDREDIDLHLHSVGDRATREALDAVERATAAKGEQLGIEVTISHLEHVSDDDVPRFHALGIHANFTPQWFAAAWFPTAPDMQVGRERMFASQPANTFVRQGANVTFSSDITNLPSLPRARPFVGIEMGVTRREYASRWERRFGPKSERLALADALRAYTVNGARQLGRENELGVLRPGHLADFVVLPRDPFEMRVRNLHRLKPAAVVLGGNLVAGELPDPATQ